MSSSRITDPSGELRHMVRSKPAQNTLPSPASTSTLECSAALVAASARWRRPVGVRALRWSGLFRNSTEMRPSSRGSTRIMPRPPASDRPTRPEPHPEEGFVRMRRLERDGSDRRLFQTQRFRSCERVFRLRYCRVLDCHQPTRRGTRQARPPNHRMSGCRIRALSVRTQTLDRLFNGRSGFI